MAINLVTEMLKTTLAGTAVSASADQGLSGSTAAEQNATASTATADASADASAANTAATADVGESTLSTTALGHTDGAIRPAPAPSLDDLTEGDIAALKAAYLDVKEALAEAQESDSAETGTNSGDAGTAVEDQTEADRAADMSHGAHGADPLARLLAEATGDSVGDIQGVLHLVREVARQEHIDATGRPVADTATAGEENQSSSETAATEADHAGQDVTLWHDHPEGIADRFGGAAPNGMGVETGHGLGRAQAGAGGYWHDAPARPALVEPSASGNAASDTPLAPKEDGALLHHHVAANAAVTLDDDVVSAVDQFTDVMESLDLFPAHGHGAEIPQMETAF
ncbi:hypothetical protein [Azospirillum sp. SYSU D00513]|uniref:hypothetical protein n=1 Tax=Azospirillum sp. SYSU D00513 TaxID=2812561 RepID=UPI001A956EE1|nr:hypothetical protein [Azospirillum sp. SYSU D00513]